MRLHAQMGNRAEALRVFGRCRELLREELGTSPSPEAEALFLHILRGV
jgi:DNA-binding SARP family transcriptional activator